MKPSLQLRLGQQLTMTPQLQQAIRLLQLSTLDLKTEIQTALESNPMLELQEELDSRAEEQADNNDPNRDEVSMPDLPDDTLWQSSYGANASGGSRDEDSDYYNQIHSKHENLQDNLLWQLRLTPFSTADQMIATSLIDALDEDGYLSLSLTDIQEGLKPDLEAEPEEIEAMLHWLQQSEPKGIGARDLQECLLLQLQDLPDEPLNAAALKIVQQHFELLTGRNYQQLMRKCKLKEDELHAVMDIIKSLNPRPGSQLNNSTAEYIYPDVLVRKIRGRWTVELNPDAVPRVNINPSYASLVKRADSSSDNVYLKGQLQEARWLLKSLESRNETLLKVANCIVEHQCGFLEYGEEAMKPLVLHDIAHAIDMHESTISRVTTQKFMHTPRGIFELKYFFSSHVSTQTGGACSSTAIRALIKKLIAEENVAKPLSDNKIAALLQEQGIKVARRTIAKYREAMQIPSSNERKSI